MDKSDLELLGYAPEWLESGALTPEFLTAQVEWFRTSEDKSTEHYRYSAFLRLQRRAAFSERVFDQYVELASRDPDPGMAVAALGDLIHHPGLTENQLETVFAHPYIRQNPYFAKKERLLRALRQPDVPLDTLQLCVDDGNGAVHRALLDLPDLPRCVVEALHERGANKAVRNIAAVRLKNQQYRVPRQGRLG